MIISFKFNHEPIPSCSITNFLGQIKQTKTMQATANILLFPKLTLNMWRVCTSVTTRKGT